MFRKQAKRQRKAPLNDASDAEIQALVAASPADKKAKDDGCESTAKCDEEDEFLKTLAAEYLSEDQTSTPKAGRPRCLTQSLNSSWLNTIDLKIVDDYSRRKLTLKSARKYRISGNDKI